jgi:RNA polymerase sigma-70 factor, ECF subfamily
VTRGEEQALVERAAAGDRAAAEGLIRGHQQSLFAYLLRVCGRPDVAEDMVQEAFVRVLANLDRFDPRFRFSTWLFTIAKRLLVNYCQRHRPLPDSDGIGLREGDAPVPASVASSMESAVHVHDALQAALMELPADQREVLVLFHQFDWPIWVIAQHMEMPEGTVKSHLHRGRRKMRVLLERDETVAARMGEAVA